jgi:hypothetical protein
MCHNVVHALQFIDLQTTEVLTRTSQIRFMLYQWLFFIFSDSEHVGCDYRKVF